MGKTMEFRKAVQSELNEIFQVYKAAIKDMDEKGIHQWDDIYPSKEILNEDIENGEMYIGFENGRLLSAFTLNTRFDREYESGEWKYGNLRYSGLHRLCVDPTCQNRGIGTQTMYFIEETLKAAHIEAVRLDAFSQNPAALRLYEKLGYKKVGEVRFRMGLFYLYEKKLYC